MTNKEYKNFDYVKFVDTLRAKSESVSYDLLHCMVGLAGESGEGLDMLKKHIWQGHPLNITELELELGDILFYLTSACSNIGTDIPTIRKKNIDKLLKRYPNGEFKVERSINRNG